MVQKKSRNLADWMIVDICAFDNFTSIADLLAKVLWIFAICLSVSNNLFGKFDVSLQTTWI